MNKFNIETIAFCFTTVTAFAQDPTEKKKVCI